MSTSSLESKKATLGTIIHGISGDVTENVPQSLAESCFRAERVILKDNSKRFEVSKSTRT
jgi:hypothetical protein